MDEVRYKFPSDDFLVAAGIPLRPRVYGTDDKDRETRSRIREAVLDVFRAALEYHPGGERQLSVNGRFVDEIADRMVEKIRKFGEIKDKEDLLVRLAEELMEVAQKRTLIINGHVLSTEKTERGENTVGTPGNDEYIIAPRFKPAP